jgi:outer membrane murein-binding lipoprotein Lpp
MNRIPTWVYESLVAAVILGVVFYLGGGSWQEAVGSLAVFVGFLHGQVSDRLSEKEAQRASAPAAQDLVHCWRRERDYFLVKEVLWLTYFISLKAWAALVGVGLFLTYRLWRHVYRTYIKPLPTA